MRLRPYGWPIEHLDKFAETQEELMFVVKWMRDVLLKESDWTQIPDCKLPQEIKDQWKLWRQYMRDLPELIDKPIPYVIVINDPPEIGRPRDWDNWDLDRGAVLHDYPQL